MYSLVLATLLTTTADVPQWGCHHCPPVDCGGGWGSGLGCYGYGGAFGCAGGAFACMGCYGGYQSWWSYAGGYGGYGAHVGGPPTPAACCVAEAPTASAPATVVVHMPQNAQLFVEGKAVPIDPATGGFVTPKLEAGGKYVYTLKAEVVRDGRVVTETKEVSVRAGEVTRVRFDDVGGVAPVVARPRGGEAPAPPLIPVGRKAAAP